MPDPAVEHDQLRRLIGVLLVTSIPLLAFTLYVGLTSGSLSVITVLLDSGVNLLLNLATFFVLRIVAGSNVFSFPYGTGKLENFTSFFHGCGIVLVGGTMLYQGVLRLGSPPVRVSLGLAQLAVLAGVLRMAFIVAWLSRMVRRSPERSPLLHVYHLNFTAGIWYSSALLLAMAIGWILSWRWGSAFELAVDLLLAAAYSFFLLLNGLRVIHANFRALLDLPLPEGDQLKILRVLTRHVDAYDDVVNVFSRFSGGRRRVEIELSFPPETPASRIEHLRGRIHDELGELLGPLEFHLIARSRS
ncbi:MAG: cation transporter [Holophagales bacterium]|nr:cation transporter [Holophagales bacterium]MBK9965699.1 cation transporter [Holophagales bacterium]